MSNDDEFDGIVSNEDEGEDTDGFSQERVPHIWDAIEAVWPQLHRNEGLLTRGLVIVEVVTPEGHKELKFLRSPEMEEWDIYGFLKFASVDLSIESIADMLIGLGTSYGEYNGEEEDEEDE